MDFFDALREVVGTERGVRIGNEGEWKSYIWYDTLPQTSGVLRAKNGRHSWPHPKLQKNTNWQVEPAPENDRGVVEYDKPREPNPKKRFVKKARLILKRQNKRG